MTMAPAFQLNAWYLTEDLGRIRDLGERVEGSSGAPFTLSQRSEGHVVLEIRGRLAPETFLSAFAQLLDEPGLVPEECILAASNQDVYPFFTHSFFRGSVPLTVHEVQEQAAIVHTANDPGYWDKAGRALHFVSWAALQRTAAPTPEEWARKIGAALIPHPSGAVFDCGWSAPWPLPAAL